MTGGGGGGEGGSTDRAGAMGMDRSGGYCG